MEFIVKFLRWRAEEVRCRNALARAAREGTEANFECHRRQRAVTDEAYRELLVWVDIHAATPAHRDGARAVIYQMLGRIWS